MPSTKLLVYPLLFVAVRTTLSNADVPSYVLVMTLSLETSIVAGLMTTVMSERMMRYSSRLSTPSIYNEISDAATLTVYVPTVVAESLGVNSMLKPSGSAYPSDAVQV